MKFCQNFHLWRTVLVASSISVLSFCFTRGSKYAKLIICDSLGSLVARGGRLAHFPQCAISGCILVGMSGKAIIFHRDEFTSNILFVVCTLYLLLLEIQILPRGRADILYAW